MQKPDDSNMNAFIVQGWFQLLCSLQTKVQIGIAEFDFTLSLQRLFSGKGVPMKYVILSSPPPPPFPRPSSFCSLQWFFGYVDTFVNGQIVHLLDLLNVNKLSSKKYRWGSFSSAFPDHANQIARLVYRAKSAVRWRAATGPNNFSSSPTAMVRLQEKPSGSIYKKSSKYRQIVDCFRTFLAVR